MKTITKNITNVIEINKSTFITKLIKITSVDSIKEVLDNIKTEYKDATHYCYAYIIDDNRKSSDDGEPGGTAGVPIMEVLLKNELNYILCVVIRYFGGIKLGSSGLIKTYRKSVVDALKKDELIKLIDGYKIKIISDYSKQKQIDFLLKDFKYTKSYNENIEYIADIDETYLEKLENQNIKITILEKKKIEV